MAILLVGGPLDGAEVDGPPTDTADGAPERIRVEGEDGWYSMGDTGQTYIWVEACECGEPLDTHPALPRPLPWAHGRPCAKTSLDRGHGWDGRPAVAHTPAVRNRWTGYGKGLVRRG